MIYAYLRVSTDKQDAKKQKHGVVSFAKRKRLPIDKFIEDTVSGTKNWKDRELGILLTDCDRGDELIFSEVSRIGRNLLDILGFLKAAKEKEVTIHIADIGYTLDDTIASDIMVTMLGLVSQIERSLISSRTKTALSACKAKGMILGRPIGSVSVNPKLAANHNAIEDALKKGVSIASLAKLNDVNWNTMSKYIDDQLPTLRRRTKHQRKGEVVSTI